MNVVIRSQAKPAFDERSRRGSRLWLAPPLPGIAGSAARSGLAQTLPKRGPPYSQSPIPRYNGPVPFTIRDFQPADFDTLWSIDQHCFPPGISYSRAELKLYISRRGSFTLLAVDAASAATAPSDSGAGKKISPPIFPAQVSVAGFIVAEAA